MDLKLLDTFSTILKYADDTCSFAPENPSVTHIHTTVLWPSWILSRTTRVSRHQKGKTRKVKLEQEIVTASGISWVICKSAP